jgi:hypothetical protein
MEQNLPPGWVAQFSEQHRRNFYRNTLTGEKTWTAPLATTVTSTSNPVVHGAGPQRPQPALRQSPAARPAQQQRQQRPAQRQRPPQHPEQQQPRLASAQQQRPGQRPGQRQQQRQPQQRAQAVAQQPGNIFVYVIGGGQSASVFACEGSTCVAERFDISTRRWELATELPAPRGGCAAAYVQGQILLFGDSTNVESLDVEQRRWDGWQCVGKYRSHRLLHYFQGVQAPVAANLNGLIYLCGGFDSSGAMEALQIYLPHTQRTAQISALRIPRFGCGCAVLGQEIYVCGGRSGVLGCTSSWFSSVEIFNPVDDAWRSVIICIANICRVVWNMWF